MSQWKKKEQLSVTRCHCLVAGGTRRSVALMRMSLNLHPALLYSGNFYLPETALDS